MLRFYFSELIGAGAPNDEFRPATTATIERGWAADDLRSDATVAAGHFIVWADVDDSQHAQLVADARNTWIPFENALGDPLPPSALVGDIAPARRVEIRALLEAHHVPTDDIALTDRIRMIVARIVRRKRLRNALALRFATWQVADSQDFSEAMGTLVSAVPAAKRQAINARLTACGFDTSVILGTDTVRQVLQKLAAQNIAFVRNGWD